MLYQIYNYWNMNIKMRVKFNLLFAFISKYRMKGNLQNKEPCSMEVIKEDDGFQEEVSLTCQGIRHALESPCMHLVDVMGHSKEKCTSIMASATVYFGVILFKEKNA